LNKSLKIDSSTVKTPGFIFDEVDIIAQIKKIRELSDICGANLLYSIKACSSINVLKIISPLVDGFSCSSLNEIILSKEILGESGTIHFTSPCIRPVDAEQIANNTNYIHFNSTSQWKMYRDIFSSNKSCGIRVNPALSYIDDNRYDPCRAQSKLGVQIDELAQLYKQDTNCMIDITGLHFHTNCDSDDLGQLAETVNHLCLVAAPILENISWINLGGGYLLDAPKGVNELTYAINRLRTEFGLKVFLEPGAGIVRGSGYLVSSVVDVFDKDGVNIVVLDTTVNHLPEVFEYQYEPSVLEHIENASFRCTLAGSTCLSGDVFGEYSFKKPLEVGDKVIFNDVGAYSMVKAHTFNGISLPTIYTYTVDHDLILEKQFTYDDFKSRLGENSNASLRKRNQNTSYRRPQKSLGLPS